MKNFDSALRNRSAILKAQITLSSLPQGWHGVITAPKKSGKMNACDTTSSVPVIRKKWNAPQSVEECRSKLPMYRKSSIPSLPNGYSNKTTPPRRNSANLSSSQVKLSASDQKISFRGKESQAAEIGSLKKELTTTKTENSILKAKFRRLSDENNQKSRQIEKLKAEMQNGPLSIKSKKESESLVLRQKCLRLEGALKEKEVALKNLMNEAKSAKVKELKDLVQSYHKEIGINNGPDACNDIKNRRLGPSQCDGKLSSMKSVKNTIRDRVKGEVMKLRDMLHKLQEENRVLQQQSKEKDLEIRRLKLHMQMKIPKPAVGSQTSVASTKPTYAYLRANTVTHKRASIPTITPLKNKPLSSSQNLFMKPTKVPVIRPASPKRVSLQKQVKSDTPTSCSTLSDPTFVVTKAKNGLKPKQPLRKLRKPTYVINKINDTDIEARVQDMRENVAARKIQRSWRHHRKQMLESEEFLPEKEQALTLIQSVLRDYKARKDRIFEFASKEGKRLHLIDDEEKSIIQEVQVTAKKLWS